MIGPSLMSVPEAAAPVISVHTESRLEHVVYGDVMRTADKRAFRGIIRIRIISEEAG